MRDAEKNKGGGAGDVEHTVRTAQRGAVILDGHGIDPVVFSRFGRSGPEVSRIDHLEPWTNIELNIQYFQEVALTA